MPKHLKIAYSYIGLREIRGDLHNPTILEWLKYHALNIGRWGKSRDETPWCAVFVSAVLRAAGYKGTDDARAISYRTWGRASKLTTGAVVVIRRRKGQANTTGSNRGGYHVGFLVDYNKQSFKILSGNQRNQVSVATYLKKGWELVAVRQPESGWLA